MSRYYMGGICGMGMSPLAAFLAEEGCEIDGLDDAPNPELKKKLEAIGVKFRAPGGRYDGIVISTALARRKGEFEPFCDPENIMRRGECWAKICKPRKLTAVVGSHGKSTVSALMAHAITKLGLDGGYLVGAIPNGFPMHRHCAEGKTVISEIDESDATIENFSPEITVALNADLDHTDTYADEDKLAQMFARLFSRTKGTVVYPSSDAVLAEAARRSAVRAVAVQIGGDYFSINKQMALAGLKATFPNADFPENIFDDFAGLQRRNEKIFDNGRLEVVSDYAHHPNEVKSFLARYLPQSDAETFVFFQPHRYTRTKRFAADFAKILSAAAHESGARIFVLPVYAASEIPAPLGESDAITKPASPEIKLARFGDFFNMANSLLENRRRARIAFVGAGDFHFAAKKFFSEIK